jgi:transcriptional regulator with XRE-family HTH domain
MWHSRQWVFLMELQDFLSDFVFRDCRLESHPAILSASVLVVSQPSTLVCEAVVPRRALDSNRDVVFLMEPPSGLTGYAFANREAVVIPSIENDPLFLRVQPSPPSVASALVVPILEGEEPVGVIRMSSAKRDFFSETDVGRVQLLAALVGMIQSRRRNKNVSTEAAAKLGQALSAVRQELGLTQDELAHQGGLNRIALSQWERGRWPASLGPIYKWCSALGLVSSEDSPTVSFLDVTPQLLDMFAHNPDELRNLSPDHFERVIAERIDRMGYDVQLTGRTNRRDGGIDLVAVPKVRTSGSFLMAAQIKHHRGECTTGRPDVDRLLAWKDSHFRVGLLVTNTTFSKDARWLADQANNKAFLRLRDFDDLKRWLRGEFGSEHDWRELPDFISLAPGITVRVPKARLKSSREVWPLSGIRIVNKED